MLENLCNNLKLKLNIITPGLLYWGNFINIIIKTHLVLSWMLPVETIADDPYGLIKFSQKSLQYVNFL